MVALILGAVGCKFAASCGASQRPPVTVAETVPDSPRQSQSPPPPPSSQKAFGSDAVWKEGLVLLQIPHQIPEASPPHPLILVVAFFLTGPLKNTNIPSPCSFLPVLAKKKKISRDASTVLQNTWLFFQHMTLYSEI